MGEMESTFLTLLNAFVLISVLYSGAIIPHLEFLALMKVFSCADSFQSNVWGSRQVLEVPVLPFCRYCSLL